MIDRHSSKGGDAAGDRIAIFNMWPIRVTSSEIQIGEVNRRYVAHAAKRFGNVRLICPEDDQLDQNRLSSLTRNQFSLACFRARGSHINYILEILRVIRLLSKGDRNDLLYMRVPDPFRWLPVLLGYRRIIYHFVGDPLELMAVANARSIAQKLKRMLYAVEEWLILQAIAHTREARVYANGALLTEKLERRGVKVRCVISSTLDVAEKQELEPRELGPEIRLIHVGYLRYSKNLDLLVDVAQELRRLGTGFTLDIVGDGDYRSTLEGKLQELIRDGSVRFRGHINNRAELRTLLRSADIFLFPSLSEGSPRVIIEAMAEGVPVISTRVGSLPDVFSDDVEIAFVDNASVEAFVGHITRLIREPQRWKDQRSVAYERVWSDFTLERFLDQVMIGLE